MTETVITESDTRGLDVERLAEAIEGHDHIGKPSEDRIACDRGHVERCADSIAARYNQLAGTSSESNTLPNPDPSSC